MVGFNYKSITDPLYGYVGLSELEAAVVSSTVFQRLHNVRQLGLAHLVFPSAGYSRFAHSVGACHVAGRILDAITDNSSTEFKGQKKQAYRLAALLHDVGHYPFSHATEHAIQSYYVGASVLDFVGGSISTSATNAEGLGHEQVGRIIIEQDRELDQIFTRFGFNRDEVLKIFSKTDPDVLFGLISSDLDCDRLDYLRRSAYASGVPYGVVDSDFIISKATIDKDGILCFQSKASTAIDHFLVSRFYDYMQVVYHKTVAALERSLGVCIMELLKRGILSMSSLDVSNRVKKGDWAEFDDNYLFAQFKALQNSLQESSGTQIICDHLRAVLFRSPAKLVYSWEAILDKDDIQTKLRKSIVIAKVAEVCRALEMDDNRFEIIVRKPFPFSSDIPVGPDGKLTYGEQARSVSILDKGKRKSRLLSEREDCLISRMSGFRNFSVSVLYLPKNGEPRSVRDDIRKRLSEMDQ